MFQLIEHGTIIITVKTRLVTKICEFHEKKFGRVQKKQISIITFPSFSGVNSWNLGTILPPAKTRYHQFADNHKI